MCILMFILDFCPKSESGIHCDAQRSQETNQKCNKVSSFSAVLHLNSQHNMRQSSTNYVCVARCADSEYRLRHMTQ